MERVRRRTPLEAVRVGTTADYVADRPAHRVAVRVETRRPRALWRCQRRLATADGVPGDASIFVVDARLEVLGKGLRTEVAVSHSTE